MKNPVKIRSVEARCAILHCKGGVMRDRRKRRPKDARRIRDSFQ